MFYTNLNNECERQGLKITPLVKECGGAAGSISAWKKGATPNSDIVVKLSVRLNVSCDYLLRGIYNTCPLERSKLTSNEIELINTYRQLGNKEKHEIHSAIYREIDGMNNDAKEPKSKEIHAG